MSTLLLALASSSVETTVVGPLDAVVSLTLVAVAVGLSRWKRLGLEASILWACLRAAVQLLAVGFLLRFIIESSQAAVWAWVWVAAMVVIAGEVVRRRSPTVPALRVTALVAVAVPTALVVLIIFGLRILETEPVAIVVIAGITIGNTLPAAVLAAKQLVEYLHDQHLQVEALLALGFDAQGATRFITPLSARTALIPQIERTKVVGLVALPGALTGLLLAGVDATNAVLTQLVVMYLVLGSVATAVAVLVTLMAARAFTVDSRMAEWTRTPLELH
ncbi:MAG: ABC transporter permease [Actinomycetia bacterium]|nr:ABC transporter permease [Actinomycetes bacterium]